MPVGQLESYRHVLLFQNHRSWPPLRFSVRYPSQELGVLDRALLGASKNVRNANPPHTSRSRFLRPAPASQKFRSAASAHRTARRRSRLLLSTPTWLGDDCSQLPQTTKPQRA